MGGRKIMEQQRIREGNGGEGRGGGRSMPSDLSWSLSSRAWLQSPRTYKRANGKISLNSVTTQ